MPLRFRADQPEPTHTQHVQVPEIAVPTFARQFPPRTMFISARSFGLATPVRVAEASVGMLRAAVALGTTAERDTAMLSGTLIPYGKPSGDLAPVIFNRGCFGESIKSDIGLTFNFDASKLLGRTRSGTLQLIDDQDGLRFEVLPPECRWSADLLISIARQDIRAVVCACQVTQQRLDRDQRIIERAVLLGCAVSSFYGFDSGFQISRSNQEDDEDTDEQDADFLKQVGVSGGVK